MFRNFNIKTIIVILVLLALAFYFRPWIHDIVMFLYVNPVIIQAIILTALIHYFVFKRIPFLSKPMEVELNTGTQETVNATPSSFLTPLLFVFLLIFGLIFSSWFRNVHIADTVEYAFRDNLPESSENLRLMPYSVAQRYAKDSLQLSQYKLGSESISLVDGDMSWVFPLTPDGFVIQFLNKNKGVVYVNATEQARNSNNVWEDMEIGEGMYITDNLFWNLLKNRYFVNLDDPYYLIDGENILTCLGVISYSFHFKYGIPYTVPEFEGVFVVDTDGNIELLSPKEAKEHDVLGNNRVYPEALARKYAQAYEFHLGILNKLFIHEDQIQIQDVADIGARVNRQPYLMDTQEGLKWFISAEPYGASHGIFKIFVIDAVTGEFEIFELPEDEILTGPVKSVDYVRRSNPIVDWNRFDSVEPLPFIQDQRLFWKLTVIPSDAAGIAYQAFVDAHTNEVLEFSDEAEVHEFLKGELDIEEIETVAPTREAVIEQIREKFGEIQELFEQIEL